MPNSCAMVLSMYPVDITIGIYNIFDFLQLNGDLYYFQIVNARNFNYLFDIDIHIKFYADLYLYLNPDIYVNVDILFFVCDNLNAFLDKTQKEHTSPTCNGHVRKSYQANRC